MIQSLPLTLGLSSDEWLVLDALRKKRNLSDYMGHELEDGARDECIDQAKALIVRVRQVLERGSAGKVYAPAHSGKQCRIRPYSTGNSNQTRLSGR